MTEWSIFKFHNNKLGGHELILIIFSVGYIFSYYSLRCEKLTYISLTAIEIL